MGNQDWYETKIRVRYKDTDRMGVVYYGNYLTYFEVGRAEFMRDLGLPYSYLESQGYSLVVIEAAVKYHGNVGYDSMVTIRTKIEDVDRVRVRFEYRILDEEGKLLVTGHTVHACINENMKPVRLPAQLKRAIHGKVADDRD